MDLQPQQHSEKSARTLEVELTATEGVCPY